MALTGVGRVGLKTVNPAALQPCVANVPRNNKVRVTGNITINVLNRYKCTGPNWMEPVFASINPDRTASL